jgi:two-component system OmpR family response regulator
MARILIIDDDPDMAELLGHMIELLGHTHQYTPTARGAVEACQTDAPDVVVLDVMLEETDGWHVYQELAPITDAPIIFITAWRTGENRQKAAAMRADGFLSKPISHQDFAKEIKNVLGKPARRLNPN